MASTDDTRKDRPPATFETKNRVSENHGGQVVQAGRVRDVYFYAAAPVEPEILSPGGRFAEERLSASRNFIDALQPWLQFLRDRLNPRPDSATDARLKKSGQLDWNRIIAALVDRWKPLALIASDATINAHADLIAYMAFTSETLQGERPSDEVLDSKVEEMDRRYYALVDSFRVDLRE